MEDIYQRAWQRLLKEIQRKTGWGNVELQKLMLDCFVNPDVGRKMGRQEEETEEAVPPAGCDSYGSLE